MLLTSVQYPQIVESMAGFRHAIAYGRLGDRWLQPQPTQVNERKSGDHLA